MAEPVREMATETATDAVNSTPQPKQAVTVTVQLKPVNNSDQPPPTIRAAVLPPASCIWISASSSLPCWLH